MRSFFSLLACLAIFPGCGADEPPADESVSQPTTFGLEYRYSGPPLEVASDKTIPSVTGAGCMPPGSRQSTNGVRVDQDGPLPHLWLQARSTGSDAPIALDVLLVKAYRPGTTVALESEVLRGGAYDAAFAGSSRHDSFTVLFKGQTYDFEITGVPPHRAHCLLSAE